MKISIYIYTERTHPNNLLSTQMHRLTDRQKDKDKDKLTLTHTHSRDKCPCIVHSTGYSP